MSKQQGAPRRGHTYGKGVVANVDVIGIHEKSVLLDQTTYDVIFILCGHEGVLLHTTLHRYRRDKKVGPCASCAVNLVNSKKQAAAEIRKEEVSRLRKKQLNGDGTINYFYEDDGWDAPLHHWAHELLTKCVRQLGETA